MTLRTEKATTINIGGKGGHAWAMKMGGRAASESGGARMRTRGKRGQPQARGRELEVQISSKRAKRSRQSWLFSVLSSRVSSASPPTRQHQQSTCSLSAAFNARPSAAPRVQSPSCGIPVFRPRLFLLTTQSTLFLFLLDELLCGPCLDLNSRLPPHPLTPTPSHDQRRRSKHQQPSIRALYEPVKVIHTVEFT